MKKGLSGVSLVIVLTACGVVDPNDEGSARRAAERECHQLAGERGYRDALTDSVNREGRSDEWIVVIAQHVVGPNPTMRCVYNARTNRARVER